MEQWKVRVKQELWELEMKIARLRSFLKDNNIDNDTRDDLLDQLYAMEAYAHILLVRINKFKEQ